jgi:hypothetical protein
MSVFRDFESAAERLRTAQSSFSTAEARIKSFGQKSADELGAVLAKFAEGGLLPGIDATKLDKSYLTPKHHSIAAERIDLLGENMELGGDIRNDLRGSRIAQEIADAARAKKIPVVHNTDGSQNIRVSDHIKEREKSPELLLSALAAYADSKGKTELGTVAREASERMKTLVSSFQQIQ